MRTAIAMCVGLTALLASCVATNDPDSTDRLSTETRAQQTGRPMPNREGLRIFGRRQVASAPKPDRFTEQKPVPAASGSLSAPDTPPGRQLSWLMAVFNGGSTRRLDTAFSENFFRRTSEPDTRATIEQWRRDEFADGPADIHALEDAGSSSITAVLRGLTTGRYCKVRLSTDKFGLIASITLTSLLEYRPGDLTEWTLLDARLQELGATSGLAASEITDKGVRPIHGFQSNAPLAIGGLSSLYIAGALTEHVRAGTARWDEPLQIRDSLKSLMGGRMQIEPEETEFPLAQYLTLMLSGGGWNGWGDTTAFDHLFARAGRESVEAYMARFNSAPERNRPFLATEEYFRVKLGTDRTLPLRYGAASEDDRRSLLKSEATYKSLPIPTVAANWRLPFEVERIGWFASADDISRTLADLLASASKPGMEPLARALRLTDDSELTEAGHWTAAGVAAGTEPGVLSIVWVLERRDGRRFILAFLANDPRRPLRHTELSEVASAAVTLLRDFETRR